MARRLIVAGCSSIGDIRIEVKNFTGSKTTLKKPQKLGIIFIQKHWLLITADRRYELL